MGPGRDARSTPHDCINLMEMKVSLEKLQIISVHEAFEQSQIIPLSSIQFCQ